MKKRRVLVLTHETLVPPEDSSGYSVQEVDEWRTEYDVTSSLKAMDHEVRVLGMGDNLAELRSVITDCRDMARDDPRAKQALATLARDATKGGFGNDD